MDTILQDHSSQETVPDLPGVDSNSSPDDQHNHLSLESISIEAITNLASISNQIYNYNDVRMDLGSSNARLGNTNIFQTVADVHAETHMEQAEVVSDTQSQDTHPVVENESSSDSEEEHNVTHLIPNDNSSTESMELDSYEDRTPHLAEKIT